MSRQNPFMRSTGDRYCNNCQNGGQNNCNDQQSCCDDCDDCHDKDKNPCVVCPPGPEGPQGPIGPQGPAGDMGTVGPSSFNLGPIGTYQILFQVSVTEAGQLILTLNGQDLDYTVAGRATGTSQIVGMAVVTTTAVNSVLTVRNPAGNAAALTVTPLAGGTRPVSAHLVITQIA